jgi:hypothetical protein
MIKIQAEVGVDFVCGRRGSARKNLRPPESAPAPSQPAAIQVSAGHPVAVFRAAMRLATSIRNGRA